MASFQSIPSAELDTRLESAVSLFRRRELAVARSAFESLIAELDGTDSVQHAAVVTEASYWAVRCARRQERLDDALRLIYAGLVSVRRAELGRTECLLRAELVHVLSALGQNGDALEQADATRQRAQHIQDPVGLAAAQEALASVYWMTAEWELGLTAYEAAWELACACSHPELRVLCSLGLAATEEGMGDLALEAGRVEEADVRRRRSVQLQRESGKLAAELGDEYLVMYSELNCGCSLHSLGELDEAKASFAACVADPRSEAVHGNALTMLGRIALDQGDPKTALDHLSLALRISERSNKLYPVLITLETLVDAYEAIGDPSSALATMRRFHALHVKNSSDKSRVVARAMSVKYDTERAVAVAEAQRQRADMLERSNANLASEAAVHARASMEDALTGLANRRRFDLALRARFGAEGRLQPCSVALLDIDHFKRVNDEFSHLIGDEVLRRLGALLSACSRRNDLAARYGGEEFVLLGTEVSHAEMLQVCERIRITIEQEDWSSIRPGLKVTVSLGVAHHDEVDGHAEQALEALMALADARLYRAKSQGRNQVCDAGAP